MSLIRLLTRSVFAGLCAVPVIAGLAIPLIVLPTLATAQHHHDHHGHHPPTVYGATGRPYGPTQAEYQYRLQYGHPSPGSYPGDMDYVNGYPGGGGSGVHIGVQFGNGGYHYGGPVGIGYGYHYSSSSSFGPGFFAGTVVPAPPAYYYYQQPAPVFAPAVGAHPNGNLIPHMIPRGGADDPLNDPAFRGNAPAPGQFLAAPAPQQIVEPSTPEQQIRAIRHVDLGDRDLSHIRYADAAAHYKNAIVSARDQAVPRLRLALAYAGLSRFREAVEQYKLGLALDPTWPQHAEQLVDLLGDENTMARNLLMHRTAEWVHEDIRDPDRLFLLVALLRQNGDPRAQTVLQTALALSGNQPHLVAFLPSADNVNGNGNVGLPAGQQQQPQQPQQQFPAAPQNFGPPNEQPQPQLPGQPQPPPIPMPPGDAVPPPSTPAGEVNVITPQNTITPNNTIGPLLPRRS